MLQSHWNILPLGRKKTDHHFKTNYLLGESLRGVGLLYLPGSTLTSDPGYD